MRAGLLSLVVVACGASTASTPRALDVGVDLDAPDTVVSPAAAAPRNRPPVAPPGPPDGRPRSGTIARARLIAVLDAGAGTFLRELEIAPRFSGDQFVGWQVVQLLGPGGPLHDVDLVPGDVLLAINGKAFRRPEQLYTVWESLRTANEVIAQMSRGDQKLELHFTIEPPVP